MANELKPIFTSDLLQIDHYKCGEEPHSKSDIEIIETYEICISRRGYYFLNVRNTQYDIYTEYLMLGNKDMEYRVTHGKHVNDESTIFRINRNLLEEVRNFYWHKDFRSQSMPGNKDEILFPLPALKSNPGFDSTHLLILNSIKEAKHRNTLLKIEMLTLSLIEDVFREVYSNRPEVENSPKLKSIHLDTIELAKSFIAQNFKKDISLSEIASSSFLTPFHFTRIFKKYTGLSPYTYLIRFRLKYAALLLLNTNLMETEICFQSGFNSFPHFISTFTKYFSSSPKKFRHSAKKDYNYQL